VALRTGDLAYRHDPPGCDRWCSPHTTLYDHEGKGDCDDLTILGASILLATGVDAAVAVGHLCGPVLCGGHAWVEGVDEHGPFLLESTNGQLHRDRPARYHLQLLAGPGWCSRAA